MRTTLRLDPVSIVLVVLLIAGSGTGGFFLGKAVTEKEIYNSYTTEIENKQIQNAIQVQSTVDIVNGNDIRHITLNIESITNIEVLIVSNGITNTKIVSNLNPPTSDTAFTNKS